MFLWCHTDVTVCIFLPGPLTRRVAINLLLGIVDATIVAICRPAAGHPKPETPGATPAALIPLARMFVYRLIVTRRRGARRSAPYTGEQSHCVWISRLIAPMVLALRLVLCLLLWAPLTPPTTPGCGS